MKECYTCKGRGYRRRGLFKKETCKRCAGKGELDPHVIAGVLLGWDAKPHIAFQDGTYFPTDIERRLYPKYFEKGDWPHDPATGEKLPIAP